MIIGKFASNKKSATWKFATTYSFMDVSITQ